MPALPSSVIEPVWVQFAALIPEHVDTHPLGCHNPRISDRIVFDKLVQSLMLGAAYERIADSICSATSMRNRRDEWIAAGIFAEIEQVCLDAYDKLIGLDLADVTVDGYIVKAPCGGVAVPDRPRQIGHQALTTDRQRGHPARLRGRVHQPERLTAAAPHPRQTPPVNRMSVFDLGLGFGLPRGHHGASGFRTRLRKNRDLLDELGCDSVISQKRFPLQAGAR